MPRLTDIGRFEAVFWPKRESLALRPRTDALTPEKPHLSQFRIIDGASHASRPLNIRSFGAKPSAKPISLSNKYLQRNVKKPHEP
jgi:hypothetical protein